MDNPDNLPAIIPSAEAANGPKPQTKRYHEYDSFIASNARLFGSLGLSQGNAAIACRMTVETFKKYYLEDYLEGQSEMQRRVASLAFEAAQAGSVPMIIHLCKTKLGWTETATVEHTGEIRAVVSNKPMSKEEFVRKYLEGGDDEA